MAKHETKPVRPTEHQPSQAPARYQAPRLSDKRALEAVTLFSFTCTPGTPNCNVGHP